MSRIAPEYPSPPSTSDHLQEGQGCEGDCFQESCLVQVTFHRKDYQGLADWFWGSGDRLQEAVTDRIK